MAVVDTKQTCEMGLIFINDGGKAEKCIRQAIRCKAYTDYTVIYIFKIEVVPQKHTPNMNH